MEVLNLKEEEKTRWRIRANTYSVIRNMYWIGGAILISITAMTAYVNKFASFVSMLLSVMCMFQMLKADVHFKKRLEKLGDHEEIHVTWKETIFQKKEEKVNRKVMKNV